MFCNFYPFYENRNTFKNEILKQYPFLKTEEVGKTHLSRSIDAFCLGSDKDPCLFVAAVHGAEWLNTILAFKFLDEICESYSGSSALCGYNIKSRFDERGIFIIPCLNPDGVEINLVGSHTAGKYKDMVDLLQQDSCVWQANARGVDLNHNFPAQWESLRKREAESGITSPSRTRYGGEKPLSERESLALARFCYRHSFRSVYAFHSQGREIYYDFGDATPKESREIAEVLAGLCSYKVSAPTGLAVGGGFKDWFIEEFNRPGFTFETGIGENPLPLSDAQKEYKLLREALVTAAVI